MNRTKSSKRSGYTLMELIVVIMIIAILAASSIFVGSKQVAKTRIQETSSFIQVMDSNVEEAITDMGFLDTVDPDLNLAEIQSYLNEMQDIYLNCMFDFTSIEAVPNVDPYYGFKVAILSPLDSWSQQYMFYYLYNPTADKYRITIASIGPNGLPGEGFENSYINISDVPEDADDDILDILLSRG